MRKIYHLVALTVVLLLLSASFIQAQSATQAIVRVRLSLREGPATTFNRITVMVPGTIVAVSGRDNTGGWIYGTTSTGLTGWMATRFTTVTSSLAATLPVTSGGGGAPAVVAGTVPGAATVPTVQQSTVVNTAPSVSVPATTIANLNIRSGPGTGFARIGRIPSGGLIQLAGRTADNSWATGTSGGTTGWVSVRYLRVSPSAFNTLPVVSGTSPVAAAPSSPTFTGVPSAPSAPPVVQQPAAGNGVPAIATVNVNIRSGPGTNFSRIGTVPVGQQFLMTGRTADNNWASGTFGSLSGWVSVRLFRVDPSPFLLLPTSSGGNTVAAAPPPAAPAPSGPAPVTSAPVTGFAYGGHVANLDDRSASYMYSAGMTWVKKQVRYFRGQDPAGQRGVIADAQRRGFRIMLGVVGSKNQVNEPGYFDDYAGYVAGLVANGADAIEIWNEPNIDREWPNGSINPAQYTDLLRRSYSAIKAVNPNALVISGAPAPTGFFGGCYGYGCDDAPFLAGMVAAGALNYMDCVGLHYNEGMVSPTQSTGDPRNPFYTRYYSGMVNTYNSITGGARPLCFTELGYLSSEGYPPAPAAFDFGNTISVAEQALWLDQAVSLARSGNVLLLIVWNVDFQNYGGDPQAGYAIIRPDGSCPACGTLGN